MRRSWTWRRILFGLAIVYFGVALGMGFYTFYYAEGHSYLSNDPRACVNCHIMRPQYDGWQKASHHSAATCNDCHVPQGPISKWITKMENGYFHSKGFTLQNFHEPIRIRPQGREVLQENCLRCHGAMVEEIATHPGDGQRMLDCVHCHQSVGHGPAR